MLPTRVNYKPYVIGFDELFDRIFNLPVDGPTAYPPYNVAQISDSEWIVEMAVAGFTKEDLSVTVHNGQLKVVGKKVKETKEGDNEVDVANAPRYQYQGISSRAFSRAFELGDNIEVQEVSLKDGLLTIKLERVIPESQKPRTINIA